MDPRKTKRTTNVAELMQALQNVDEKTTIAYKDDGQAPTNVADGVFANLMMVSHRQNEFVIDFLYAQPDSFRLLDNEADRPTTRVVTLRSRVITTPEHFKRLAAAMVQNLGQYETKYGAVELTEAESSPDLQ